MKKIIESGWQCFCAACMLCALCHATTGRAEQGLPQKAAFLVSQKAVDEADSAEQRCTELSAALVRAEKDLEAIRRRYAGLYLESRELQQQLQDLTFQAAATLESSGDGASSQSLTRMMARMSAQEAGIRSVSNSFQEFSRYLDGILEVLQPSDAMRHEVQSRFHGLMNQCERLSHRSPLVARRGDQGVPRRECRILAVGEELHVLALDGGFADGVAPGSIWRVLSDDTVVAKLKIVEVRSDLSAAVLIEGRFSKLAPGLLVRRGE